VQAVDAQISKKVWHWISSSASQNLEVQIWIERSK
jgi:hypothetical protein